jgi:FkbM family methyltransferase
MSDLIYDIGMHDGEDSHFYLLKGFRVVAVDADPDLCKSAEQRFAEFIAQGRLTIVNRAIVPKPGPVTFYRSKISGWGTVVEAWNRDNVVRGVAAESLTVEGITLANLIEAQGEPFYIKLDIEGMDRTALASLVATSVRPPYISMETSFSRTPTIDAIQADFDLLSRLGYDRFKIVDQDLVPRQVPPAPARVGKYVAHAFTDSASGLFGDEAPGEWMTDEGALQSFCQICRKKWLPLLLYRNMRIFLYYSKIMHRLYGRNPNLSWYDIHAKHSSVE